MDGLTQQRKEKSDLLQHPGWGSSLSIHFHLQFSCSSAFCRGTKTKSPTSYFILTHAQYLRLVLAFIFNTLLTIVSNPCVAQADNEHFTLTVSEP